jgi:hypothetical protein
VNAREIEDRLSWLGTLGGGLARLVYCPEISAEPQAGPWWVEVMDDPIIGQPVPRATIDEAIRAAEARVLAAFPGRPNTPRPGALSVPEAMPPGAIPTTGQPGRGGASVALSDCCGSWVVKSDDDGPWWCLACDRPLGEGPFIEPAGQDNRTPDATDPQRDGDRYRRKVLEFLGP